MVKQGRGTHPGETDFVTQVVKAADAVLGIFEVVILDETKAGKELVPQHNNDGVVLTLCID